VISGDVNIVILILSLTLPHVTLRAALNYVTTTLPHVSGA